MSSLLARRKTLLPFSQAASAETIAAGPHSISEVRAFQMGSAGSENSYIVLLCV